MAAQVWIRSGPRSGDTFEIDKDRMRLGSDPRCEIALTVPGLEPHSLTIECVGNAYRISNKMAASITVGGRTVLPGASDHLEPGEEIDLAGVLVISLEQFARTTAATSMEKFAPDVAEVEDDIVNPQPAASDGTDKKEKSADAKGGAQMAVIVFCFSMIPLMIFAKTMESSGPVSKAKPVTLSMVRKAVDEQQPVDPELHEFVDQLRTALAYERRGNRDKANVIYDRLLQVLVSRRQKGGVLETAGEMPEENATVEQTMEAYIKRRRSF
jgi:hypothetical protein